MSSSGKSFLSPTSHPSQSPSPTPCSPDPSLPLSLDPPSSVPFAPSYPLPSSTLDGLQLLMSWREGWLVYLIDSTVSPIKEDLTNAILQWSRERSSHRNWPDCEAAGTEATAVDALVTLSKWLTVTLLKFDLTDFRTALSLACQQWAAERIHRKLMAEEAAVLRRAEEEIKRTRKAAAEETRVIRQAMENLRAEKEFQSDQLRGELSLLERRSARESEERQRAEEEKRVSQERLAALIEKAKGDEYSNLCICCYLQHRNVLFLPCKHLVACEGCADKLATCPMCQGNIENKERVFF